MSLKKSDQKLLFVLLVAIIVSYVYFHIANLRYSSVTTFDECVTAGFPVLTKYPEECKMPGTIFVNPRQEKMKETATTSDRETAVQDFKNISYMYEGQTVTFAQGLGIASSSQDKSNVKLFQVVASSSVSIDVTDDLEKDTVFLISRTEGKNNDTTYYLATAIKLYEGYTGSNMIRVGLSSSTPILSYKNGEIFVSGLPKERKFIFENSLLVEKK